MKRTSINEISKAECKEIMLSILDEIDLFCKENNLTYFLIGGSLLGAIRHKGFIPWDDDIDIGLPRKDYEKLIKKFSSFSGYIIVEDYRSRDHYIWANAKAIDKRTILTEVKDKKVVSGVFVDIFPFDGIPGNHEDAVKQVKKTKIWKDLLTLKYLSVSKNRTLAKNIVVLLGKILYLIPDRFMIQKININKDKSIDFERCEYICNFCGAWGLKEITKSQNFTKTIDAEFEGRQFKIPVGYDDYLTTVYGDYMVLPPIGKRKTTHSMKAYWR